MKVKGESVRVGDISISLQSTLSLSTGLEFETEVAYSLIPLEMQQFPDERK